MSNVLSTDELVAKYRAERDKRLTRGDRRAADLIRQFHGFDADPYAMTRVQRAPVERDVDALITGCGISGLLAAHALIKEGFEDFLLVDEASDVGGTWYWNRYPGIRCDIESYIYLPLLEEVRTVPRERYSTGAEILEHLRRVARHFDLYRRALLQTKIKSARWDNDRGRWEITTDRNDRIHARFLLASSGFLHYPKFPNIPGIQSFKGRMFHSARWDYEYTGGDSSGNLEKLHDKRVALIGNGATGIQILPHLARSARHTYLIQRTPAAVDARQNRPTDVEWFEGQAVGWQRRRQDDFMRVILGIADRDPIDDCWTRAAGRLFGVGRGKTGQDYADAVQAFDYALMNRLRDRIDGIVRDPATAAALKPWYNLYCKRPLYSDDFFETFNLPSVSLVDTDGWGVEEITETGFVVRGVHYEAECIVFASGFQIGAYDKQSSTFPIIGRDGVTLSDRWSAGLRSVHGTWMNGFPNFQLVGTVTQAAATFNFTWLSQEQAKHAASIFAKLVREGGRTIEVTRDAENRWLDALRAKSPPQTYYDECTPGYFNNEGDTSKIPVYQNAYGGGAFEYFNLLQAWRDGGYAADCRIDLRR